jgi:hypothetical protein
MFQIKVVEKIKKHILCSTNYFPENCAVYEITWKNILELLRPQTSIAGWKPKATNTHS